MTLLLVVIAGVVVKPSVVGIVVMSGVFNFSVKSVDVADVEVITLNV